jgi:hypothetical protein
MDVGDQVTLLPAADGEPFDIAQRVTIRQQGNSAASGSADTI